MLTVFVRGLRLDAEIGVWAQERGRRQPVVIDIELTVDPAEPVPARLGDLVRYDRAAAYAREAVAAGHIDTVEQLAADIAALCLADGRVVEAVVRVEKPDALPDAAGVGAVLRKRRSQEGKQS
jgi:dihydroneopterin aldolase